MIKRFIILIVTVASFSGCVYFNTFYNLKKYYNKAYSETKKRTLERPSSQEESNYRKAIDKALKLIEEYPDSRYAAEAMFIAAKSYFYLKEYYKAERRFNELKERCPEIGFKDEVELWLARTAIELGRFDEAGDILQKLLRDKLNRDLAARVYYYYGKINESNGKFEEAINSYNTALAKGLGDLRPEALFSIGADYDSLGMYERAGKFFKRVIDTKTTKDMKFIALFRYGKIKKSLKDYKGAMEIFRSLRKDERNKERFAEIELEIADCLISGSQIDAGIEAYKKIMDKYKGSREAAEAHFRLARVYEKMGHYQKSLDHYRLVRGTFQRSEYVDSAEARRRDIERLLALKHLIDDSLKVASSVEEEKKDEGSEQKKNQNPEIKSFMKNSTDKNMFLLAELYLMHFDMPDSALEQYKRILMLFPDTRYKDRVLFNMGYISCTFLNDTLNGNRYYREIIDSFPDSELAERSRKRLNLLDVITRKDSINMLLCEAEQILFDQSNPVLAFKKYRSILQRYPNSEFSPKTLYCMAWICENEMDSLSFAYTLYDSLLKSYPQSSYAVMAREKVEAFRSTIKKGKIEPAQKSGDSLNRTLSGDNRMENVKQDSTTDAELIGGIGSVISRIKDIETLIKRAEIDVVEIRVHIDKHGKPVNAELVNSSGNTDLDRALLSAVREADYIPAVKAGKPIDSWIRIDIPIKRYFNRR